MIQAGFFECDITPSLGMERPASYSKLRIQKINDPLKVTAAVVKKDETLLAFCGVDICYLGDGVTEKVRQALPGVNILLSASHTHYGGPMGMADLPEDLSDLAKDLVLKESVCPDPHYTAHLVGQIVTAIKSAMERMEEAVLSFGKGDARGVSFNRGFKMKNGHRATHPGKGNPDIVAPFAPIDTEVGVVGFWRKADESFLGCLVNFSCHGTCDGTGATADWPGVMRNTVKAVMGQNAGVVYLYGTAGDITQIDNQDLCPTETGPKYSRIVGVTVGAEALKVLMRSRKGENETVKAETRILTVKRRAPSPAKAARAREIAQKKERNTEFYFAKETVILSEILKHGLDLPLELQLFQLGPLVIVSLPGEAFCGIGLAVKKESSFPFTWVSSLANNISCGYIPTTDVLDPETGGGYESRLTTFTCTAPDTADVIVRALNEMIAKETPDKVPVGRQIKPSNKVWDFGNNLPELE
ncbi:MAG: hypothetical protein J6A21_09505 [Lentisphaeria bacterium]|nr:hypothetical protein [Lentisphaeria bacterium]